MTAETVFYPESESSIPITRERQVGRRFLSVLLILGLVSFLLVRWLGFHNDKVTERQIRELGGAVLWNDIQQRWNIYDPETRIKLVYFGSPDLKRDQWQTLDQFSEPVALTIQGGRFNDKRFRKLFEVQNLSHLILAGTSVSKSAILDFQERHPEVTVDVGLHGSQKYVRYPALTAE